MGFSREKGEGSPQKVPAPQIVYGTREEACWESVRMMQKRAPKGTSTFPAFSGLGEKRMAKKERKNMRKLEQKDAKKKQWIPDGAVIGGRSSAEK